VTGAECTGCNACIELCREEAIRFTTLKNPEIIENKCLYCGTCSGACPSGTLSSAETGYRIFIGGMMGRHPALAGELPFIYDRESVVELFKDSFVLYNELFDSQLRFRNMVLRYPEKLPAPRREIFLTALGN
jgi:dissimilatory sulfite reductase (desulfoviridin) alpha/beta subunit